MKRTACGACGYDDLQVFLDLGMSPIADAYTDDPWGGGDTHPLQVAVCTGCHLAQLLEVVDQKTLFGTGYSFYSSASPPLSAYHEEYARDVLRKLRFGDRLVVEIGCNDGDMLRHFGVADHVSAVGVDPSGGPVERAWERGLTVINEAFTVVVAERIREEFGAADVVIANHVLAHVESVSEVLHGIAELLAPDGVAYVEVQYLPDLLTNNAFDLVYHEHRNFFSLSSLTAAAARWNLVPVEAQLTDRQGGSLRVKLARREDAQRLSQPHGTVEDLLYRERWLRRLDAYGGVQGRAERVRERLRELLLNEMRAGRKVVGYGAPAKATTLLNFCQLDRDWIDLIFDSTSAKQGRYVPGTGIPIVAPNPAQLRKYDTVLLTAWNYTNTIMRDNSDFHGRWIVPIPAPVVL